MDLKWIDSPFSELLDKDVSSIQPSYNKFNFLKKWVFQDKVEIMNYAWKPRSFSMFSWIISSILHISVESYVWKIIFTLD